MNFSYVHDLKLSDPDAMEYVIHWMRNPDKGSIFETVMRYVGLLPNLVLLTFLRLMGYDGILIRSNGKIIGHAFYQRHERHWGIFSVWVCVESRKLGYAEAMIRTIIKDAHRRSNVQKVMLGLGGNPVIKHIWRKAYLNRLDLPFHLRRGRKIGMLFFDRRVPNAVSP